MTTAQSLPDTPDFANAEHKPAVAEYFTVGTIKFALMSLTTFGLYEAYWFYRNWKVIRDREGSQIWPFWRGVFGVFWTFSLGKKLLIDAKERSIAIELPATKLGIVYFVVNSLYRLPGQYWLLSLLAFIAILPFETAARRLNGNGGLSEPTSGTYSGWIIAWLIFGSLFLLLAIVGSFIPESAT